MSVRLALALVLLAFGPAVAQDAATPMRPSISADGPAPKSQSQTPAPATPASPATPATPATPASPATPSPPTPAFSPIPPAPTAEQCRTACAQAYYFCLAENEVSDCAPAWSQCRLACNKAAGR